MLDNAEAVALASGYPVHYQSQPAPGMLGLSGNARPLTTPVTGRLKSGMSYCKLERAVCQQKGLRAAALILPPLSQLRSDR